MIIPTILASSFLAGPALTFAFFGCNRVDAKDLDPVKNPSSANQAQLAANLSEVAASGSSILFAGGDIVNGYADDDGKTLAAQLAGWSREVAAFPKSVGLVPISGNHELNRKVGGEKMPSTLTYPVWKSWLMENGYLYGTNGPIPATAPKDSLALDESKMSYTMDRNGVRFIVLNTDTRTTVADPKTGTAIAWIPSNWTESKLIQAEKDPSVRAVFILGHRNLIDPSEGIGDAPIDKRAADKLVAAMRGKKKLRAYVCAHVHAWNVRKIPGTNALQIISGDGGSKLEKDAKREFGWVEIRVARDGKASYIHHHRPVPTPYNSTEPATPSVADIPVAIP